MLPSPHTDPTPIFEWFRGAHGTELLVAATRHFRLFEHLQSPLSWEELRERLELERRPMHVVTTAMRAMGLVKQTADGILSLTPMAAEHLLKDSAFDVSDYLGLAAESPGVLEMLERLRSNRPAGADEDGAAFIFRDGVESAMEEAATARQFTLALAGRARNVAPHLARELYTEDISTILDVGGGTGIYSIALLRTNPNLRAIVFDRPEVLKVAEEMAEEYDVAERMEFRAGDMFSDPLPADCQLHLLSNILHDWDEPQCSALVQRCADAMPSGGRLAIHDVFLDDDLGGPLPIALYSASLFSFTEGRAYSAAEYQEWLRQAGLHPAGAPRPTLIHCGVLEAHK